MGEKRLILIFFFVAIITIASFGFSKEALAGYYASSSFISINLLQGVSPAPTSIDSFVYNLSAKPASTTATVGFNQDGGSNWYNAAGDVGTETLVTGADQAITLTSGWSGANFYYKVNFTSDGISTAVLDDITLNYTVNTAPTNGAGSITDMDDTDNIYAQRKFYTASSTCSDADGFADVDYCEFRLKQGAATRAIFRYDEDTDTFSVESGSSEWDLDGSSSAVESGTDITIIWKFTPQWDAVAEDDLEIELYIIDAASVADTDTAQSDYVDVVTDLVATFSLDDDRGNISQSIIASGTVIYAGSLLCPPDAEFTIVSVYDSANNNEGTSTVVNGDWSVTFDAPATVGTDTYNLYIDMADADYTDEEEATPTDGFITDQVVFKTGTTLNVTDGRVNADASTTGEWHAELMFNYDDSEIESGAINLNSGTMTWDAGQGRWEYVANSATVQAVNRNIASVSGLNYGITSVTSTVTSDSETIIYDRIKILTLSAVNAAISVGTEATWYATAELEYDNHSLTSGDSFTLSGYAFSWDAADNRFEATSTKNTPQTVTINAFDNGSEATYGITAGNINGLSQSIEWQDTDGGGSRSGGWLNPPQEPEKGFKEKIVEEIKKIPEALESFIPEFFKPKPPEEMKPPEVPVEELVPRETPLAFKGRWELLTYTLQDRPFVKFTLAPLPKEFQKLAEKFPELEKTFAEVGIQRLIDIENLKSVKLTLPGLAERVGLPTAKIEPGGLALLQGIPIAKMSPETKKQIPTEIVFAKTGGELIDFNITLSVTEEGEAEQKITTISGKPLQLVVKPENPVKGIKGYVVFKSKGSQPTSLEFPLNSLLASLIFANPVFAKPQEQPVEVEEKLVLLEFEYTDPDGDGIYTAEIQAPLAEGEYEIITVMDYEDPGLGQKEIRLITVVDPEGYVYEKADNREIRIPEATIYLFWLNPDTKQHELWPAKEYYQENPQITDVTGKYSFLVPPGTYYLKTEHSNYPVYQSAIFTVKEGSGIHMNIELKTRYWWLKILDWKIIVMILFGVLLLYNFYRDKIREKKLRDI